MESAIAHVRTTENGKLEQPLSEHLSEVSRLTGEFAAKAGLKYSGKLIGLLHDFGKYSTAFQNYLKSSAGLLDQDHDDYVNANSLKGKIDHSTAGAQYIWQHFSKNRNCAPYAQILSLCVASHHSGLIDCLATNEAAGACAFIRRLEKETSKTHFNECCAKLDSAIDLTAKEFLRDTTIMEEVRQSVLRIHKQADSAILNQYDKDRENLVEFTKGLLTRFLLSCLLDADRINSITFEAPEYKELRAHLPRQPWGRLIHRLENHLAGMGQSDGPMTSVRGEISEDCKARAKCPKGLFTLTVPTGGGKTLASLRFALHHAKQHGLDRVIYTIPYTSIIDQNAAVAREILEMGEAPGTIVLEQHSNLQPEKETWQSKLLDDNWESPVVFTTMVQFLESLFGSGTRSARRMHNLAKSVLIFDEIQTLPVRCVHLFCNALNFLVNTCGSSAVLCTATQPRLGELPYPHKGQLALTPEQEIISNPPKLFTTLKRVSFFNHCAQNKRMTEEEIAGLALEEMHGSRSCLIVCNTKKWAERLYTGLKAHQAENIYYLSTNLCPAHRMARLGEIKELLQDKKPVLCISTQLIEAGVDISFGSVIRFAAGLDSILQAAGRCNRHKESELGRVHIVTVREEEEPLNFSEDIKAGRGIFLDAITHGCAPQLEAAGYDLTRPEFIEIYFEHYFNRRKGVMEYGISSKENARDDSLLNMLGKNSRNPAEMPHYRMLRQSFASAAALFKVIDAPTQGIIVPYGEGENIINELYSSSLLFRKRELLQAAQRYTINIFSNTFKELQLKALRYIQNEDIYSLDAAYYSLELGLLTAPGGQPPVLQPF